jgi:hypothetical protein
MLVSSVAAGEHDLSMAAGADWANQAKDKVRSKVVIIKSLILIERFIKF